MWVMATSSTPVGFESPSNVLLAHEANAQMYCCAPPALLQTHPKHEISLQEVKAPGLASAR